MEHHQPLAVRCIYANQSLQCADLDHWVSGVLRLAAVSTLPRAWLVFCCILCSVFRAARQELLSRPDLSHAAGGRCCTKRVPLGWIKDRISSPILENLR